MPTYNQSAWAINESPISDGGTWATRRGNGASTDGAGDIQPTPASGWDISALENTAVAFDESVYVEATVDYNSDSSVGVAACAPSNAGFCALVLIPSNVNLCLLRRYFSNYGSYTSLPNITLSAPLSSGDTLGIEISDNAGTDIQDYAIYINGILEGSGTLTIEDSINEIQPGVIVGSGDGTSGRITSMLARDAFVIGATISTVPATIARGETGLVVTGIGFEADQNSGSLLFGGELCLIESWADTAIGFTAPLTIELLYTPTLHMLTVITDSGASDTSEAIPFTPPSGIGYLNLVSPDASNNNFMLFGVSGIPAVTSDQMEFDLLTTPSNIPNIPGADSEWIIDGMPLITQTTTVRIIRAATGIRDPNSWVITYLVSSESLAAFTVQQNFGVIGGGMRKNLANQNVGFQMNALVGGGPITVGTPIVYFEIDGGNQAEGGGISAHKGNGSWGYAPTQAETNGNYIKYTMVLADAVTQSMNVWPVSFDPTSTTDLGLSTLTGNVPQTGDVYPLVDIANAYLVDILEDTSFTLDNMINGLINTVNTVNTILIDKIDDVKVDTTAVSVDTGASIPQTIASLAAQLAIINTVADAIKLKSDQLTFTAANELDVNIQSVNDVSLVGDGNTTPFNVEIIE